MQTTGDITLSELMGDEYTLWVGKNKKFGFDMQIERDYDGLEVVKESGLHPYAMESFAALCRSFLTFYDRISN